MLLEILLIGMVVLSVAVFVDIQLYVFRHDRRKFNKAWFAKFKAFNERAQQNTENSWRYNSIDESFYGYIPRNGK